MADWKHWLRTFGILKIFGISGEDILVYMRVNNRSYQVE